MVERSDRMWSTGDGNGKPLQYSCLENPMNSMKRKNGTEEFIYREIPLVQGKEQWLRFAGAAVKRYPTPKVRETQVRR